MPERPRTGESGAATARKNWSPRTASPALVMATTLAAGSSSTRGQGRSRRRDQHSRTGPRARRIRQRHKDGLCILFGIIVFQIDSDTLGTGLVRRPLERLGLCNVVLACGRGPVEAVTSTRTPPEVYPWRVTCTVVVGRLSRTGASGFKTTSLAGSSLTIVTTVTACVMVVVAEVVEAETSVTVNVSSGSKASSPMTAICIVPVALPAGITSVAPATLT